MRQETPAGGARRPPPRWTGDATPFVDGLLGWIEATSTGRYDDVVSQIDHALQCAALAAREGASDAEVAAALLHDVGHLLMADATRPGDLRHEQVGADWLARAFGPEVCEPVRQHVAAKRYLCAREPAYLRTLTDASIESLALQGGPMTEDEAARFERLPGAAAALALRRRDDRAKVPGLEVPGLASYRERLVALAGA